MIFIRWSFVMLTALTWPWLPPIFRRVRYYESGNGLCIFGLRLAYTLCQIPGGWFLDRVGSRVTILLRYLAGQWRLYSRALPRDNVINWSARDNRYFRSARFPANNRMVTSWFPEHERASAVGFIRLVSLSVWRF